MSHLVWLHLNGAPISHRCSLKKVKMKVYVFNLPCDDDVALKPRCTVHRLSLAVRGRCFPEST